MIYDELVQQSLGVLPKNEAGTPFSKSRRCIMLKG